VPSVSIRDPAISTVVAPFEYTGTGTEQSISGLFEIGFLMVRNNSGGSPRDNFVFDSLRGATKYWSLYEVDQETTDAQTIKTFDADGFTIGTSSLVNDSTKTYYGHAFRAPEEAVANTSGTISSTTAVGQAYSIVTYTGNGTAGATFGHGLPTAPQMVWVKRLSGGFDIGVAGGPVVGDNHVLDLDTQDNRFAFTAAVRTTSSSVVTVGNGSEVNVNGSNYVAYAFADVPGVSKIGTYVGDGDADGLFIDCDFLVDFLLVKKREDPDTGNSNMAWLLFDRKDLSGTRYLELSSFDAFFEADPGCVFEGKGFRVLNSPVRASWRFNSSGATYLYMAFSYIIPTVEVSATNLGISAIEPTVTVN
jgi:hypothetical protein